MPTPARLLLASACLLIAPLVVMADELPNDTNTAGIEIVGFLFASPDTDELPNDTNTTESPAAKMAMSLTGPAVRKVRVIELAQGDDTGEIESLTVEQARRLVETYPGANMYVREIDGETVRTTAWSDGLSLRGLKTLGADVAKALSGYRGTFMCLDGLTTLDADAVKALAEYTGDVFVATEVRDAFIQRNPLSPKTALAHAVLLNGDLPSVTTLDSETAEALAGYRGNVLLLSGLTTLDADTAAALAKYAGHLKIRKEAAEEFIVKHPFGKDTARVHAALLGGRLSAITAFESPDSVAIAKALASRKGPLSLPNLEKISPKTLTALIKKRDVVIPLIETLEFIPEPDGSANEDFKIPKWLEVRQKQRRAGQQAK